MRMRIVLIVGIAALLTAAVFVWSGLFNVAASSGHFKLTGWFLHYVMRQSVKTHSMGIVVPNLDNPVLIRRGGAHFETACVSCHGSPLAKSDAVVRQMTPPPPPLEATLDTWEPPELFWIVKHGIKYTGMPAWPAQDRDDEVWAVVAFLRVLSTISVESYQELAFGSSKTEYSSKPTDVAQSKGCTRCHGRDGKGVTGEAFPRLDIQTQQYLNSALQSYVDGRRQSGLMEAAVAGLTIDDIDALARYFSTPAQLSQVEPQPTDNDLLPRGRTIAEHGIVEKRIPACRSCHQSSGALSSRPDFPRLEGQHQRFLTEQLMLFAAEKDRGGTPFIGLMSSFAHKLDEKDIEAVAAWYASFDSRSR